MLRSSMMTSHPRSGLAVLVLALTLMGSGATGAEKPKASEHHLANSTFLKLPGLTTNVMRANGRWGVVTIEAGIDIPDEKLRTLAEHSIPRLRDAYTRILSSIGPNMRPGSQPDVDRIADSLQRATDAVLGRPGAKFLIGSVIVN